LDSTTPPCRGHPRLRALDNKITLELADRRKNVEQQLSRGRSGVDALIDDHEIDAERFQLGNEIRQVAHAAGEAVEFHRSDRLDLAPSDGGHQLVERRALILPA
jgi:hypothetical protein